MPHIVLVLFGSKVEALHRDLRNINGRPFAQSFRKFSQVGISFADPTVRQLDQHPVEALWNSKLKVAMSQ